MVHINGHPHFIWNPPNAIEIGKGRENPRLPAHVEEYLRQALSEAMSDVPWLMLDKEFAPGFIDVENRRFTSRHGDFVFQMSCDGRILLNRV